MKSMPTRRFLGLALLTTLGGLTAIASIAVITAVAAPAAAAQPLAEALRAQLRIEERLLDRARDQYRDARSLERDVLRNLQESANRQDTLLNSILQQALTGSAPVISEGGPEGEQSPADPISLRLLRSAERELAGTRETALTLARESAQWRRDLIARAARVGELRLEIARHGGVALVDKTGLDGLWQIELTGAGITGVIDFNSEGTLVTGSYRLTDGSQGSIRGTLANNRLDLERIDWARGFDTILRGELNAAAGVIEGTWIAVDVSGGAPGSGSWTGRRVSRGSLAKPR